MDVGGKTKGNKKDRDRRELMEIRAAGEGKLPPQSLELEEAVLGALMLEKDALTDVVEILHPQTFIKKHTAKYFMRSSLYSGVLSLWI